MTLHLPLKERWFRMIQSGEKREEYREITPYWCNRLAGISVGADKLNPYIKHVVNTAIDKWRLHHAVVHFTLGYPKKDNASRHMIKHIKTIEIGTGRPEWGAEPDKEYFVIKLED